MNPDTRATLWRSKGAYFQLPMIALWFSRGVLLPDQPVTTDSAGIIDFLLSADTLQFFGFMLMGICMLRIYAPFDKDKPRGLITTDVFAVTRHPMYHGMFFADAALFFTKDISSIYFWVSWVIFMILLLAAGWHQEKETLARWGKEAEVYYERTPRFFFEWTWFWAIRRKANL